MSGAILVSVKVWFFLALATPLGLAALWPLLSRRTSAGMLLAPLVGWALLTYLLWILGFVGVPFHAATLWILLLASCAGGAALLLPRRERLLSLVRGARWTLVCGLLVFLVAHFFLVEMRICRPDIHDQEKFMDLAFYNSLRVHGEIPPPDPWLSSDPGQHFVINYYYGGYMMAATAGKALGLPPGVAYNLNLCVLYAFAAMGAFVIAAMLTGRKRWGLLATVWVVLSGNMFGAWQVLNGTPLGGIDIWKASRMIVDNGDTITEFPVFSFAEVGDMHPHMMALPLAFVMLFLAYAWMRRSEAQWRVRAGRGTLLYLMVFSGLWLAIMGWTNIFDVATYGLFLFTVVFLFRLSTAPAPRWTGVLLPVVEVAVTGGLALLFLAPFLLTYHPPQSGKMLEWVPMRSDLGEYLLMWGMHAAIAAVVVGVAAWGVLTRWKSAQARLDAGRRAARAVRAGVGVYRIHRLRAPVDGAGGGFSAAVRGGAALAGAVRVGRDVFRPVRVDRLRDDLPGRQLRGEAQQHAVQVFLSHVGDCRYAFAGAPVRGVAPPARSHGRADRGGRAAGRAVCGHARLPRVAGDEALAGVELLPRPFAGRYGLHGDGVPGRRVGDRLPAQQRRSVRDRAGASGAPRAIRASRASACTPGGRR